MSADVHFWSGISQGFRQTFSSFESHPFRHYLWHFSCEAKVSNLGIETAVNKHIAPRGTIMIKT